MELYHALEHLADAGKAAFGALNPKSQQWLYAHREELRNGDIEAVVRSLKRLRPSGSEEKEIVRKEIEYFKKNQERMRYQQFRKQGLFIGSGVIEAGCKTVIGRRLKQKRDEMGGERSEFDNCIEVLPDDRALGQLLGGACRSIVCTTKTHTLAEINY